ncbi:MAG: hypothetical protein JWQ72_1878 [Polaromonas sp.]|nr:hypothetical protein [Polaromonas sp.]
MVNSMVMAGCALTLMVSGTAMAQGIYTCVDGKGRKITSDRQIAECVDRAQQELSSTGTVKRVIGPTLTAQERAAQEEKDKLAAEVRAQAAEEKRRDRALLLRYPDKAVHDKERGLALASVDEVIKASAKRSVELSEQRKVIDAEFEFHKRDPAKAPPPLKRRLEENENSVSVQKRFVADQDLEKRRVNLRFDEELVKLRQLWALMGPPPSLATAASAAGKNAQK